MKDEDFIAKVGDIFPETTDDDEDSRRVLTARAVLMETVRRFVAIGNAAERTAAALEKLVSMRENGEM